MYYLPLLLAAVNLLTTVVAVGMAYGRLKEQHEQMGRRLDALEHKLGNGSPGVFAREREVALMRAATDHRLEVLEAKAGINMHE